MNKHYNANLNETIYTQILDNGLTLVVLHKEKNVNTSAYLAFPYGSLNIVQQDEQGKTTIFNPGVAHFLEHKLLKITTEWMSWNVSVNSLVMSMPLLPIMRPYITSTPPEWTSKNRLICFWISFKNLKLQKLLLKRKGNHHPGTAHVSSNARISVDV